MTVTRLGQVTAETGSQGEFLRDGSGVWAANSTIVHTGNYSWRVNNGFGSTIPGMGMGFESKVGVRGNFAFYQATVGAYPIYMISINSGGSLVRVLLDLPDDEISLSVNGVAQSTISLSGTGFEMGRWVNIGFFCMSGDPGAFRLYIDGNEIFTFDGAIPEQVSSVFLFTALTSNFTTTGDMYVDDYYLDGLTSDEEIAAPSSRRFLPSAPTVAYLSEWTPMNAGTNLGAINESIANNDTDYVKTLVAGVTDRYQVQAVVLPTDYKIRAVIPTAIARKGDTGVDAEVSVSLFDGLNTLNGDAQRTYVSYRTVWSRFVTQPDLSQWDEADYSSMIAGYTSEGAF